ncbi:MAG: hypothetical protein J1E32_06645 [Treponema sp.]|nr:hypothetical protein [Treponema sp.]
MRRFLCALALCAGLCSCVRQNVPVQFDRSDPLALNPEIRWAVVTDPYAACYADAGYGAAVAGHFRRGAILQIIGERTVGGDNGRETWYAFEEGWLPQGAVAVYANKMRAQTAVKELGVR